MLEVTVTTVTEVWSVLVEQGMLREGRRTRMELMGMKNHITAARMKMEKTGERKEDKQR